MSARNDMTNYDENDGSRPQSALESLEQQRIAEVFRAQSKLLGMKAFRVNNEKFYKDKELSEIRKKEIAEPLEEALTTIEVLQEKVSRRDAMISKLRKFITVDLLKGQQQEDLRAKVLEINQVDEQNQVVLMDTIRELQRVIEVQANQITRCKDTIAHQKECNKQAVRNMDMQEFSHKELIRQIENDKDSYVRQADVKEKRIQELLLAKQTLEKRVERFDEENKETVLALQEARSCVRELQEAAHQAQSEFDELQARYSATEFALLEARENLVELRERHVSLRTRYEALVAELDEMVEAGCTIPAAEELKNRKKDGNTGKKVPASPAQQQPGGAKPPKPSKTGSTKSNNPNKSLVSGGSINAGSSIEDSIDGGETPARDYSNPDGTKFDQRMRREDQESDLLFAENRAARQGDVLGQEVAHLRQVIAQMKSEQNETMRREASGKYELESAHALLKNDISRITTKNQELSTKNFNLINDLQDRNQRVSELEEEKSALRQQAEELAQQLAAQQAQQKQMEEELAAAQEQCAELEARQAATPQNRRASTASTMDFDDELPTGDNDAVDFGAPPEYNPDFDINDYISAPPVDVATQMGASEFYDMGTQFPYAYDPDYHPQHKVTQTNVADFLYPMEHYLETLFRDFVAESQTHIPENNWSVLRTSRAPESSKEPKSRLGRKSQAELPPLVEEAAVFRVKRGMVYLSALNEIRNKHVQFINQTGSWNSVNTRMVVRCLDLVLQTMHNVLCPAEMLEDSDYTELRKAVDSGDEDYYSDLQEDSQVYGELKAITAKWKSSTKAVMKRPSTFKLTESELAAEHNYGAPKGILNFEPGQILSKAVVKFMNRSARRRTVENVDLLLDRAEGKVPPAPLDKSPSHRMSAPPSRGGTGTAPRSNSASPERLDTAAGGGVSRQIASFAAKALAVATSALQSDNSSPDVSPIMGVNRKRLSTDHRIPEIANTNSQESAESPESGIAAAPVTSPSYENLRTIKAVQGYYNFGADIRLEGKVLAEQIPGYGVPAHAVEPPPSEERSEQPAEVENLVVKVRQGKSVAAAFNIADDSDTDESVARLASTAEKLRKKSRAAKRGSTGQAGFLPVDSDYVDYTRIPFDAASPENTIKVKKLSVSVNLASARKGSQASKEVVKLQHELAAQSVAQEKAEGELKKTSEGQGATDLAPVDAFGGVSLQAYMNQMVNEPEGGANTSSATPFAGTSGGVEEESDHRSATLASNRVPFPKIASAEDTPREDASPVELPTEVDRAEARTPTLADRADRLQQIASYAPPQPVFTADRDPVKSSAAAALGLKTLLQKNIEASAMAVYQLQDQQRRRQSSGEELGLVGSNPLHATAGLNSPGVAHPPQRTRPSSTKQSTRQSRHKARDIDWSSANYVPDPTAATDASAQTVSDASSNANHASWISTAESPQSRTGSRGMSLADASRLIPGGKGAFEDTIVTRNASPPPHSPAGTRRESSGQFADMVVAGRKRSVEASREKVTNAILYM